VDKSAGHSAELIELAKREMLNRNLRLLAGMAAVALSWVVMWAPIVRESKALIVASPFVGLLLLLFSAADDPSEKLWAWVAEQKATRRLESLLLWLTGTIWRLRRDLTSLFVYHACLDYFGRGEAVAVARRILSLFTRETIPGICLNTIVDTFITYGRYRDAVALSPASVADDPDEYFKLTELNIVEAEYNLGRLDDARRRLERLKETPAKKAIVAAGLRQQDAWLLALEGQSELALGKAQAVARDDLPKQFHAEVHFTRALPAIQLGRFEHARAELQQALACALRQPSIRNYHFLMGLCERRAGALESALEHFARGVAHPYRGQGGDALLAYGQTLEELQRSDEARRVYDLLLERDPESRACARARERLRVLSPGADLT
jgi:tetratricopeptide (TPR) repeat protein